MAVPLSRELRTRFHRRSIPVRKGDTVRILSGSYVGSEERVARVDRRSYTVILNNITLKTGEQKQKPLPIRTAHLLLTKLNLSDAWRRRILSVAKEELTPEELGTPTSTPEETGAAPSAASPATPPEEDTMKLTDAEREFIEDAGTEEHGPPAKAVRKQPEPPSTPEEKVIAGEIPPKDTTAETKPSAPPKSRAKPRPPKSEDDA